eukprot:7579556-Ditylum_brightwellii.AAC.1
MLMAEKTCCSSKYGYDWSIKLVKAGKLVQYWKMRKSLMQNKTDFTHLHTLAKVTEVENDVSLTLSDINKKLTEAQKALRLVQKNVAVAQDTHLEELARHRLKHSTGDLAATIKNIQHCDELKQAFQSMKPITKGITGGVVNELLIPNPEKLSTPVMYPDVINCLDFEHATPFLVMDDQDEIMSTLIKRNKLHLHQSFDTPFATQTMQEYIRENGTGLGAKEILDGNFDPNQFDNLPAVNYWIKHNLRRTAAQDSVDINLTKEELKSMLKKQSESMSSSPSGQHYGHYKVLI